MATWKKLIVPIAIAPILLLLAYGFKTNPRQVPSPLVGNSAPPFALSSFDGGTPGLERLRGTAIVLNFWASWCVPCAQEAAELESTWRHYQGRPVAFIGVDWVDTETEARDYLRRFDITYPNGPDLGTRISQAYRIRGAPETFIVDKTGILRRLIIGPTTQADLQATIEQLLAQ